MAHWRQDTSLPSRLLRIPSGLLVALFGLTVTASAWLYVTHQLSVDRAAEIERVYRENGALASAFEENVRRVFQAADNALLYLKFEYEKNGRVTEAMTDFVDRAKRDTILNQIALVDADGSLVVSAVPRTRAINVSHNETFQVHAASASLGLFIGKPILTQLAGTWSFFLTRRLNRPDGTFAGIVAVALDPAYFERFYEKLELSPDRAVLLVGRDGIVRARRFQKQSEIGQNISDGAMFARIPHEPVGHHEITGNIDHLRRFASYRALPDFPLVVAVSDLTSSALAPYLRRRAEDVRSTLIFTLFVALSCSLLIAAGRRERRQHERLAEELAERRRAEEKIRQSEGFIRSILDTVDEGFIVVDRDYRILTANKAYCGQVSLPCEQVIGERCFEISHKSGRPCFEMGEECAVRQVFETGRPHTAIHKHPGRDGQTLFVETKAFPIKDDAGNTASVIETLNNITERHLLEEERLKTQKLESIGTLAGGIAHDFNNLLQGVFGYISLAKMSIDRGDRSFAMIEQAEKALRQSVSLTTQLLTFSRGGKPVREPIPLEPVIDSAVKFALSGSRSEYRLALDPGLWLVDADAGQLAQVIQNVAMNADQAMPRGGSMEITARNVPPSDPDLPRDLPRRNHVVIAIRDNGSGIHEPDLERIFDPYFTTKEKGSGLGLATSYSIVRNHEGRIFATSEVGKGSTFFIYLPAAAAAAAAARIAASAAKTRAARILLMDDEEMVRNVARELLTVLGHTVAVADRGETAIESFRSSRDAGHPFDLVILDLTIRGGMGGVETVQRLREINPGVKAVASSGYSDDAAASGFREQGFTAFLKKPYNIRELQEVLNIALG
ncbi:MAG: hybrid sensor histidine kinase/response regulator [Candidatus Methylomirabilia bacterium]